MLTDVRSILASIVLCAAAITPAHAQSNELTIIQQGAANSATIEQNAGPRPARRARIGSVTRVPNSTLDLSNIRDGQLTLTLPDETRSELTFDDATVGGLDAAGQIGANGLFLDTLTDAASQIGDGNEIDITIEGSDATIGFVQAAGSVGGQADNTASISATGDGASASLFQSGTLNDAALSATAQDAFAGIVQIGNGNNGRVAVTGRRARGTLVQIGDANDSGEIIVDGVETNIVVTQQGNGLAPAPGAPGISVLTNAPSVTITQTAIGR